MSQQPDPIINAESEEVLPLVLARLNSYEQILLEPELRQRAAEGLRHYGVPLMTHNGRDALRDALDELLDALKYILQYEKETGDIDVFMSFDAIKYSTCRLAEKIMLRDELASR